MKELREFEIRFDGLYGEPEVFAIKDGHLKHDREIVQVIELTPLTRNAGDMLEVLKLLVSEADRETHNFDTYDFIVNHVIPLIKKAEGG